MYELKENRLLNPKLILDLHKNPGASHIGGVLAIGPDKNIYLTTGDGESCQDNRPLPGVILLIALGALAILLVNIITLLLVVSI